MALVSSMGTLPYVPAPTKAATLLVVAAIAASCGGSPSAGSHNTASHSPSPSASASATGSPSAGPSAASSPSPPPVTGAYGVLYSSQAASSYTVSIIGVDAKVVASAQVSTPPLASCANSAAAVTSLPNTYRNARWDWIASSG